MSRSRTSNQARTTVWESEDLADHCQLIARQVQKSLEDPETRKLAVKIAGHRPDSYINENGVAVPIVEAWGLQLYLPPVGASPCAAQNDVCEIQAVWNFLVANVRYVLDPDGYDLFCTLRRTLEAGSGDCDDMCIAFASLLRALGFANVFARVVSTDGKRWAHVYPVVALPKSGSIRRIVPLDITVAGSVPGWQFKGISHQADYKL